MGDPTPSTTLDEARRSAAHRDARLALPAVTLGEWAELYGVKLVTARTWADAGHLPAWRSGTQWLVRPTEPVPPTKPPGRPRTT